MRVSLKAQISRRLREVRQELFGEHGGPELARRLNLPARTWYNYESGVTVPAEVLLGFIDQTNVNPAWLLAGEGDRYRRGIEDQILADLTPEQLIRRGLEKLEQQPLELGGMPIDGSADPGSSDFVAVELMALGDLEGAGRAESGTGHILAYRQWIPHPRETVAVRIDDTAMHPILPPGSVVAVDRTVRDAQQLRGRMVAARTAAAPVIRWLEVSGRHMILRPNQTTREFPLIPLELELGRHNPIIGQVVWSWSRFMGE